MFTCRKELEELMGLRHPRKVTIEESNEVPRAAERFFRGLYAEPDKLKRFFSELARETGLVLELLGMRRAKTRDWQEELPAAPDEAEEYLLETAAELKARYQRVSQVEEKVLTYLQQVERHQLFPIEEELLGKWSAERIIMYTKVIDQIALLLKLPAVDLHKALLAHFMGHVLLYAAEDRDGRVWARTESNADGLEKIIHYYLKLFYKTYRYKELGQVEVNLLRYFPQANRDIGDLEALSREQVNAATVFWRRQDRFSLEEILRLLGDFA
ncbi:MAG TPA: hypothetical protein VHQ46_00270 [Desulfobacteria bacterium]|nr:hypothetical protein [Desulfobacteria bacterium]